MSNVLKVTTSVSDYNRVDGSKNLADNAEKLRMQNPAALTQAQDVERDNPSTKNGQYDEQGALKDYSSNLSQFIQKMGKMTPMAQTFSKLLFENLDFLIGTENKETMTPAVTKFLSMIQAEDMESVLSALKSQVNQSVRYKGVFFDVMRRIFHETDSVELKGKILDFMRRCTDMQSGQHIMENIRNDLRTTENYMFQSAKGRIQNLMEKLQFGSALTNGDVAHNVKVLKEEVLPFLNEYITKTHDRGPLRDAAARLASNIARYENGDGDKVKELFKQILDFGTSQKYLKGMESDRIIDFLKQTDFEKTIAKDTWNDQFLQIVKETMSGKAGLDSKAVFQDFMQSVLLNESVFMPMLHIMLPIEYEGTKLFSEMWIDPDAENSQSGSMKERAVKLLVKFEIQDVGFFDLYLLYKDGKVEMQLDYPEELKVDQKEIREQMNQIMARNGLSFSSLVLEKGMPPIPLFEAFPKLLERKNTINVKI